MRRADTKEYLRLAPVTEQGCCVKPCAARRLPLIAILAYSKRTNADRSIRVAKVTGCGVQNTDTFTVVLVVLLVVLVVPVAPVVPEPLAILVVPVVTRVPVVLVAPLVPIVPVIQMRENPKTSKRVSREN